MDSETIRSTCADTLSAADIFGDGSRLLLQSPPAASPESAMLDSLPFQAVMLAVAVVYMFFLVRYSDIIWGFIRTAVSADGNALLKESGMQFSSEQRNLSIVMSLIGIIMTSFVSIRLLRWLRTRRCGHSRNHGSRMRRSLHCRSRLRPPRCLHGADPHKNSLFRRRGVGHHALLHILPPAARKCGRSMAVRNPGVMFRFGATLCKRVFFALYLPKNFDFVLDFVSLHPGNIPDIASAVPVFARRWDLSKT